MKRPMSLLSKEAILGASDLKTTDVDVPEWGGTVRVRSMTGTERDALNASLTVDSKFDRAGFPMKLIARCVVDEEGKALFTEADVVALNAKNARALERVFNAAHKLNSFGEEAVEAAVKN